MIHFVTDNLHKMLWESRADFGNLSLSEIRNHERPAGHGKNSGLYPELRAALKFCRKERPIYIQSNFVFSVRNKNSLYDGRGQIKLTCLPFVGRVLVFSEKVAANPLQVVISHFNELLLIKL